jgi:hypothetical protein
VRSDVRAIPEGVQKTNLLIGTSAGVYELTDDGPREDQALGSREVTALAAADGVAWAITDRRSIARRESDGTWTDVARSDEFDLVCLLPMPDGLLAGTDEAHLLRLDDHTLGRVAPFDAVEGRDVWYTPWGGPPAVRSIARDLGGRIHANVHVGGIPRSLDGGASWEPTIDIDADVHQVVAHPNEADVVVAAGAVGLAISEDGGASWRIEQRGLHATYARAVAVAGDTILLSVSNGPRGGRAAVYRTTLEPNLHLEKCTDGLPEWFDGNIDSGWLVARDSVVAFGSGDGLIFLSDDEGESWTRTAEEVPSIRSLWFV